jgi:methyl-accepting chemotaxis protein
MISRGETAKDTAQVVIESAATHVGRIATIITSAVRDIARELGEMASDAFEMREAAQRAAREDPWAG